MGRPWKTLSACRKCASSYFPTKLDSFLGLMMELKQQHVYWMRAGFRDGQIGRPPQTLPLVSMISSSHGWPLLETSGGEREPEKLWSSSTAWQMRTMVKVWGMFYQKQEHLLIKTTDYPWEEYATPIVDIGGGMGSLEEMLLSVLQNKELTFTIFDINIEKTIDNSTKARQHDLNLHFLV